jgi:hypothetical protein
MDLLQDEMLAIQQDVEFVDQMIGPVCRDFRWSFVCHACRCDIGSERAELRKHCFGSPAENAREAFFSYAFSAAVGSFDGPPPLHQIRLFWAQVRLDREHEETERNGHPPRPADDTSSEC